MDILDDSAKAPPLPVSRAMPEGGEGSDSDSRTYNVVACWKTVLKMMFVGNV